MLKIRFVFIIFLSITFLASLKSQNPNEFTYRDYLKQSVSENLLLTAEKYKLDAAAARVSLAKIFPNPIVTIGNASGDVTNQKLQQQIYAGVTQTIPRANKREANVNVAKAELSLEQALYEDYLRVFKLDITKRFVNVLIAKMDYAKTKNVNDLLQEEFKLKINLNDVNSVELSRIKIEAGQIASQFYQAEEELNTAIYELYVPLASFDKNNIMSVTGNVNENSREFNLDSVIPIAIFNRADIIMFEKKYKLTREHEKLITLNRKKDFDIQLGDNYYTKATNYIAPTPAYHAITGLITFPVPFSNLHKEDLEIAKLQKQSAESELKYAQNHIEVEIRQSYERFKTAEKQVKIFHDLLKDVDKVVEDELNNYKQGKSAFLDLSESHRKQDEVYSSYFQALKTYVYSLLELEDDMGIWDIDF